MGYNLLLLLAAAIWGFGIVAQSLGMTYLGPYAFTGIRFFIGTVSLLPLLWFYKRQGKLSGCSKIQLLRAGLPSGGLLFIAISLQQVGLLYTTSAKAGFITGLYVILVPFLGIFLKHKTNLNVWIGCLIALIGLFLLSVGNDYSVNFGDILQLIGAFFWAGHILTIDYYSKKIPPVLLAFFQFFICGILSLIVSFCIETPTINAIFLSWKPLLYAGLMSVGIAYTLQVICQKHSQPTHAAIILSLEAVFAAIGGVLILNEVLDTRALIGCGLMLLGMIVSQLTGKKREETREISSD